MFRVVRNQTRDVSPPDCLIVQPAGGAAGEAVVERCPQLGRCGNLSRGFLAGVLGVAERQGVAGSWSLVVEQHTCKNRANTLSLRHKDLIKINRPEGTGSINMLLWPQTDQSTSLLKFHE